MILNIKLGQFDVILNALHDRADGYYLQARSNYLKGDFEKYQIFKDAQKALHELIADLAKQSAS